jgi:hypothetical protein
MINFYKVQEEKAEYLCRGGGAEVGTKGETAKM